MKPHPRIRKAIKWGGAAVTVLLIAAWAASLRWTAAYTTNDWTIALRPCGLKVRLLWGALYRSAHGSEYSELAIERAQLDRMSGIVHWPSQFILWPSHRLYPDPLTGGSVYHASVPFWLPLAGILPLTVFAWRRDTRARRIGAGCCPKCGYDRAGLPGGAGAKCPECGAVAAAR